MKYLRRNTECWRANDPHVLSVMYISAQVYKKTAVFYIIINENETNLRLINMSSKNVSSGRKNLGMNLSL